MTDEANPWDQPGAFGAAAPKPEKQPRQRKAREAKPPAEPAAPKVRKPREVKEKAERAPAETVKISIKEYAEMRVTAFQREFVKLHKILAPIPAKARAQMLAELGKVLC